MRYYLLAAAATVALDEPAAEELGADADRDADRERPADRRQAQAAAALRMCRGRGRQCSSKAIPSHR